MKVKRARAARRRPAAGDDDAARAPAEPEAAEVEEPEPEAPVEAELVEVEPAGDGVIDVEPDAAAPKERQEPGLVRRDPLGAYMAEIRRIPLLSREEETELAKKYYATGDVAIAKRLITANLRLVVKIAHEYRRAYRNLLDLIQEGNIGLMQAMRKYDPYRGVKLSSYAAWWIRAYILKFILNNWRLVKIGTTQAQRKLFFNLRKEKEKLEQLGFAPEADTRPDVRVESEEFRALLRGKLEEFARGLKDREALLFRERWLTDAPLTLQELGDRFGISRERARQIEKRLLDRLRTYLEAELGTAVDIGAMGAEE